MKKTRKKKSQMVDAENFDWEVVVPEDLNVKLLAKKERRHYKTRAAATLEALREWVEKD